MALFSALSISSLTSGVLSRGVEALSRDISSAVDKNYQRQIIKFESGQIFQGVNLGRIQRATNQDLQDRLISQTALLGQAETVERYFNEISLETGFDSEKASFVALFEGFESSLRDFQATPESDILHNQLIQSAGALTDHINNLTNFLNALRTKADEDISDNITQANVLINRVSNLNNRITIARSRNISSVGLENQRDTLLRDLSSIIEVRQIARKNGVVEAYLKTGHVLVGQATEANLLWDVSNRQISIEGINDPIANNSIGSLLPAGSLSAQYNFARADDAALLSRDANVGVAIKFQRQISEFRNQLIANNANRPDQINTAYLNAPVRVGEHNDVIFQLNASGELVVHSDLVDGTARFKVQAVLSTDIENNVLHALEEGTRTIPADPAATPPFASYLHIDSAVNYRTLIISIVDIQGNLVNRARDINDEASDTEQLVRKELLDETGVNIDETLLRVNELQKNFIANARLIQIADRMLEELLRNV